MILGVGCTILLLFHGQLFGFIKGELTLSGHPSTPTSRKPFTLSCTSNDTQLQNVTWVRENATIYFNPTNHRQVVGGVLRNFSVRVDDYQYNLTTAQFSEIDGDSVWQCRDRGETSNTLTFVKAPVEVTATSIRDGTNHNLYTLIAVGVVILVTIVTITVICYRRRKATEHEDVEIERTLYFGSQSDAGRRESIEMSENTIYTSSSSLPRLQVVYDSTNVEDLYAKVVKQKTRL